MQSAYILPASVFAEQYWILTGSTTVTLQELSELSDVAENDLVELTRYGVLTPIDPDGRSLSFDRESVAVCWRAGRLRKQLDLDEHAFALTVMFFHKLVALEIIVGGLRAEVSRTRKEVAFPEQSWTPDQR